ncbi:MAG: DNA-binding protein [Actinomycetota bacterium]|nr:DNA-binding protein [Actinomycetota bacterium]
MSFLRELLEKLARPPEDIRAENLRHWSASIEGTTAISEVVPRQRVRAAGVVTNIRIDPREGRGSIEATVVDGTGSMVAKWLGRAKLSGIRLGAGLVIEGLPGKQDGDLVVLNPEYELVPGPERG